MKNDDLYNNLVTLLKMFKNRPHHLAKYFIENSSLDKDFIRKISENGKLKHFRLILLFFEVLKSIFFFKPKKYLK